MAVRVCLGKYAKTGYEPDYMGCRIYSVEELCYFIKENAYLLDEHFVKEDLGRWLIEECDLKDLGEEIKRAGRKKISVKTFVGILMDYTGFLSLKEVEEIGKSISENSNKSIFEKRKAKADAFLGKGHLLLAEKEYSELLREVPVQEARFRGELYHGWAVCLAKMFYYTKAGEYFLKAYELTGNTASYRQYLWTKRLNVNEGEYVEFLKSHREAYEDSIEMEDQMEEIYCRFKQSSQGLLIDEIKKMKEQFEWKKYQDTLKEQAEYLKDSYIEMTGRNMK